MSPPCCRLQRLPDLTPPVHTSPDHTVARLNLPYLAQPNLAKTTLNREQQGASCEAPCCRLQLLHDQAIPVPNVPFLAVAWRAVLGLTPKDAQHDQATSASIRLRVSVTGITSASKRPCLGLQSPSPTSLPASVAISSTSRRFNTSGSY